MSLLQALGLRSLQDSPDTTDDAKAAGGKRSGSLGGAPPPPQTVDPFASPPGRGRSQSVGSGAPSAPSTGKAPSSEQAVYDAARADIDQLVAGLDAHPMRAKLDDPLRAIAAKLQTAAGHAAKAEWPAATKALNEARADCVKARKLADDWQTYKKKFARGREQQQAWAGWNDTRVANAQTRLDRARDLAENQAKLPEAIAELDTLDNEMMAVYRSTLKSVRDRATNIESQGDAVRAFLAKPLGDGRALIAQAEAALARGEFSQALLSRRNAYDILATTEHHAELRKDYETRRTATLAAIAGVKALPAMADRGPWLDGVVARADALASYAQLKIREGQQVLVEAVANCKTFTDVAPTVAAYNAERALADGEIDALDASAGAAGVTEQRKAIRSLLGTAATSAAAARASNASPGPSWQAALEAVRRARADLVVAAKLATDMGAALGAQRAAAGGADADPAAMKKALAALRADLAKALGAAHADSAEKALKRCGNQADDAGKALDKQKTKDAARHLREAGEALAEARAIQAQHGQYVAGLAGVEQRLSAMQQSPRAKAIKERIQAVERALKAARKDDKRHEGTDAMAGLRAAIDAVAAAEKADRDRLDHDKEAKVVADRIDAEIGDKKLAKALHKSLEAATDIAGDLDFASARIALRKITINLDAEKLNGQVKKTPFDKNAVRNAANALAKAGGGDKVDALIEAASETDPDVITALASGRYDMDFEIEPRPPSSPGGAPRPPGRREIVAMKRICEVFATIPGDVRDNPSIKKVTHVDAVRGAGGGYTSGTREIGMHGRVGLQQEFGSDQTQHDPKTGKDVRQIPDDIEENCKPATKDKVEYLGFAAAHEVGHGVDDLRGFMLKYGSQPKYGGWTDYGASVQPIAYAAGEHIAKKFPGSSFYKTPETKKYVLDKIMSRPTDLADPPAGSADEKAVKAFNRWHAIATTEDVYRRQSDCDEIKIGNLIYHEAYPRIWVSYLASARRQALTGYQFRSGAEWFAELYAGWKSGRLGPKHPALEWLTKL